MKTILNLPVKEDFVQAVWQHLWFNIHNLKTHEGASLQIIKTGYLNRNAGPDFSDALIEIDGVKWAGNIEIHLKSSDWFLHKHHQDAAYNNVILHVVLYHDAEIYNSYQNNIPVLELYPRINPAYIEQYKYLLEQRAEIPCKDLIHKLEPLHITQWLERLAAERLEYKSKAIFTLLAQTKMHWEQVLYITLASNFGFYVNKQPFEQLAYQLPLSIITKHQLNRLQIEALIFGTSGVLEKEIDDAYYHTLQTEFIHLKNKYNIISIDASQWKYLRTRPHNFPTIRLAQFAALMEQYQHLFSKFKEAQSVKDLYYIFQFTANSYWENHYRFGEKSTQSYINLGSQSIDNIIINTIVPILFAYGKHQHDVSYTEKALKILADIKSENNKVVSMWSDWGVESRNASESQSLLHLKNTYCHYKKCMNCNWGKLYIKNSQP